MHNARVLKAVTTGNLSTGGKLNPQQADRFIDFVVQENQFLQQVRTVRMSGPEYDLDYMDIAKRLIRRGIEGQEPTNNATVALTRRRLSTTEVILPVDVSKHFLEDNIERAAAEDHIARLVATQFGNDLLDLAINGDTATPSANPDYEFLSIDDGWIKLAKTYPGTHKVDTEGGTDLKGVVFPRMVDALPDKWLRRPEELRIFCSRKDAHTYARQLAARQTALADELLRTGRIPQFEGIDVQPVPYWPSGVFILTFPENLAVGIQRDFTVDREYKPRKRVTEYTLTARIDAAQIVVDDALVIAWDMTPGA